MPPRGKLADAELATLKKWIEGGAPETAVGAAKIFKWVDEKGVTHYGETIPVEYKDQAAIEMSKHGITVRKRRR